MEHREPPATSGEEHRARSVNLEAPQRLALPSPGGGGGAIDRARAARWAAILAGLALGSSLLFLAAQKARSWLGDQAAYQLPFRAIVLDPPPPSWFRGGAEAFLDDVRRRAGMPERIPILKVTKAELRRAFEHSPWTEAVERVAHEPLGVTVRVVYCRPVAVVEVSDSEKYLISESGIILPREDVDRNVLESDTAGALITIKGRGLCGPLDATPGLPWKPRPGVNDLAPGNALVRSAARLARFLTDRLRTMDRAREPALNIQLINPMDTEGRGFFLWNAQNAIILWGDAPGEERPGSLTALEKWERLSVWSRSGRGAPTSHEGFWKISPDGVEYKVVTEHASPESAPLVQPRRDQAAIPAKAPGHSGHSLSR